MEKVFLQKEFCYILCSSRCWKKVKDKHISLGKLFNQKLNLLRWINLCKKITYWRFFMLFRVVILVAQQIYMYDNGKSVCLYACYASELWKVEKWCKLQKTVKTVKNRKNQCFMGNIFPLQRTVQLYIYKQFDVLRHCFWVRGVEVALKLLDIH